MKLSFPTVNPEMSKGAVLGLILVSALVGFEIFNFDTTRYALRDVLGGLTFLNLEWAGILAFAFCSIDFAGLLRLFTPEQGRQEPKEVWLLTGAWLLGATMNAMMTWYAVALAIGSRPLGATRLDPELLATYTPIFVAILVWLTRLLFIGSIAVAGERLLHQQDLAQPQTNRLPMTRPRRDRPATASQPLAPELNGFVFPNDVEPS